MDVKVVGIDLGKDCCSLVGRDASGAATLRRRVRRDGLLALTAKLAPHRALSPWRRAVARIIRPGR